MKTPAHDTSNSNLLRGLVLVEAVVLTATTIAFWYPSPPIRDNLVWLLWFAVPIFAVRGVVCAADGYADLRMHRANQGSVRAWLAATLRQMPPLLPLFAAFIVLTLWNFTAAPYHRANYLVLVCRPLLGMWLVIHCMEHVRRFRQMTGLVAATITAGLIVGVLSLTATQWSDKSAALKFIIQQLKPWDYKTWLPDMALSFNANEIAGALAWLCPLLAGLMLYPGQTTAPRLLRVSAAVAFALSFAGLFLGQDRFAIGGVLVSLAGLALLCVPGKRLRYVALAAIAAVVLIQAALTLNVLPLKVSIGGNDTSEPSLSLSGRDESSLETRAEIWASALRMIQDYPLTGVGMSKFRTAVSKPPYIVPYYADKPGGPPHAHNEWLQVGADLGIPGLLIFVGLQVVTIGMLWKAWRSHDTMRCLLAVAVGSGLFAHAVYGVGDAITLWDRFSFLLWWLIGLAAALYTEIPRRA